MVEMLKQMCTLIKIKKSKQLNRYTIRVHTKELNKNNFKNLLAIFSNKSMGYNLSKDIADIF